MTNPTFKFEEDEESKLVALAKEHNESLVFVFKQYGVSDLPLHTLFQVLNDPVPEEFLEEGEEPIFLPSGETIYRQYGELQGLAASSVMFGEVAMIAESHGYQFRFLKPNEVDAAVAQVEGFSSYHELIKKRQGYQAEAHKQLQKADTSKMTEEEREGILEKIKTIQIQQTPIGIFSKNSRMVAGKQDAEHYLCMMSDGKHPETMRLFSEKRTMPLNTPDYFAPSHGKDEIDVEEHFME
jgi:hypothetical protein